MSRPTKKVLYSFNMGYIANKQIKYFWHEWLMEWMF